MKDKYGTIQDPGQAGLSSGGAATVVVVGLLVVVVGFGRGFSVGDTLVLSQQT